MNLRHLTKKQLRNYLTDMLAFKTKLELNKNVFKKVIDTIDNDCIMIEHELLRKCNEHIQNNELDKKSTATTG